MQKRVYLRNLSYNVVLVRLSNGEKVYQGYTKGSNEAYIKYFSGFLISYNTQGGINVIGKELNIKDGGYYFIDEVEEPEADESCMGKVCWFWDNDNGENKKASILLYVDENNKYKYIAQDNLKYKHCKPLTEEEALALVKEK